jgi:hypothetical protein
MTFSTCQVFLAKFSRFHLSNEFGVLEYSWRAGSWDSEDDPDGAEDEINYHRNLTIWAKIKEQIYRTTVLDAT